MGAVAQLGERQLCKLDVVGSIPIGSTRDLRSLKTAYAQVGKNVSSGRHRLTTGPRWTLVFSMKVKEQEER
jgi:hypothetical protein